MSAITPESVAAQGLDVLIATYRARAKKSGRAATALRDRGLPVMAGEMGSIARVHQSVIDDLELLRGRISEVGS